MTVPHSYGSTIDLLNDVAEFLEGQADVRDGSDGPRPNKAMELMARAEIEIERLKRDSRRGPNDEANELMTWMQRHVPDTLRNIRKMYESDKRHTTSLSATEEQS
jgi:hypothetical protein